MQMCSGVRSNLLHSVGVHSTSFGPMRYEMLPPLPSTYWRCHSFLPVAMISALIRCASGELNRAERPRRGRRRRAGWPPSTLPGGPPRRGVTVAERDRRAAACASSASGVMTAPLRVTISFGPAGRRLVDVLRGDHAQRRQVQGTHPRPSAADRLRRSRPVGETCSRSRSTRSRRRPAWAPGYGLAASLPSTMPIIWPRGRRQLVGHHERLSAALAVARGQVGRGHRLDEQQRVPRSAGSVFDSTTRPRTIPSLMTPPSSRSDACVTRSTIPTTTRRAGTPLPSQSRAIVPSDDTSTVEPRPAPMRSSSTSGSPVARPSGSRRCADQEAHVRQAVVLPRGRQRAVDAGQEHPATSDEPHRAADGELPLAREGERRRHPFARRRRDRCG